MSESGCSVCNDENCVLKESGAFPLDFGLCVMMNRVSYEIWTDEGTKCRNYFKKMKETKSDWVSEGMRSL